MVYSINDDIFTAIAHPVRRSLLDDLTQGEMSVSSLAQRYEVSRPAISQHLRILLEAGLVDGTRDGRHNKYVLRPDRLTQVHEWLRKYEIFWSERMSELGKYLDHEAANEKTRRKPAG